MSRKKKNLITFSKALLCLLLVVSAAFYYVWLHRNEYANQAFSYIKTTEAYRNSNITFDTVKVSIATKSAKLLISNVQFDLKIAHNEQESLDYYAKGQIDSIELDRLFFLKTLLFNEIHVHDLNVYKSKTTIYTTACEPQDQNIDDSTPIKGLKINIGQVHEAFIRVKTNNDSSTVNNLNIDFEKLATNFNKGIKGLRLKQFNLTTEETKLDLPEPYRLQTSSIRLSTHKLNHWELTITDGKLETSRSLATLGNSQEFQTAFYNVEVENFRIHGKHAKKSILKKQPWVLNEVEINKPKVKIYKNTSLPLDTSTLVHTIPEKLKSLPIPLTVKKLNINHGAIYHTEKPKTNFSPFELTLKDINATINNLSSVNKSGKFHAELSTVLHHAHVVNIDLDHKYGQNHYLVKGEIQPYGTNQVDLKIWNEILPKVAGIKVKEGRMQSCTFDFKVDLEDVTGWVDFRYQKLKLEFLKSAIKLKPTRFIVQSLTNNFFIYHSNPYNLKVFEGKVEYERNPHKSFTFNWLHGLIDGIQNTLVRGIVTKTTHFSLKGKRKRKKGKKKEKKSRK